MSYTITDYSKKQAKKLGVKIQPSNKKNKKIDIIFKNKIISIGDSRYKDYGIFLKEEGKSIADEHRKAYKLRHNKDRKIKNSKGYWADKILW